MLFPSFLRRFLPRTSSLAIVFSFLVSSGTALLAQTGFPSAADGFDPNVDGTVNAQAVQPNGKVLIGGTFTTIRPNNGTAITRQGLARLNSDGSVDTSFGNPGFNGPVNAIGVQTDGRIVVTGSFSQLTPNGGAAVARSNIARLNADGSIDFSFAPVLNTTGLSLVVQTDGSLVVGGTFTTAQSSGSSTLVARNRLVRFSSTGVIDATFDPNANQSVLTLTLQLDGRILVGGFFTSLQPNGAATALVRNHAARLNADGSVDTGFDPNTNGQVYAFAVQPDGRILVGGNFTSIQPNGAVVGLGFPFLARLNADGSVDSLFNPFPSTTVLAIKVQSDGKILLGGNFVSLEPNSSGSATNRFFLARVNSDGTLDGGFNPTPNGPVNTIEQLPDGKVLIGGTFTQLRNDGLSALATTRNHFARVNLDGSLDTDFEPSSVGRMTSMVVQPDGKILLGGNFVSVGGITHTFVARVAANGSVDSSFNVTVNNQVNGMALQADGKVVIVGRFSTVNGTARNNVARLNPDGSLDTTYDPSPNFDVDSVTPTPDGKMIVGGLFTRLNIASAGNNVIRNFVARINTDGTIDTAWDPNTDASVAGVRFQTDGKSILYGGFTRLGPGLTVDVDRAFVARLNVDGTLDRSLDVRISKQVNALVLQTDGKFVVSGDFSSVAGKGDVVTTPHNRLARFSADGTLDTAFNPSANGSVNVLVLQPDGKIVLGGAFTVVDGVARTNIARLNADGTLDTTFNPNPDGQLGTQVSAIALQSNGQVVFSGGFTSVAPNGGTVFPRMHLVRVNADGNLDTGFDPGVGGQAGVQVNSIVQEPGGAIIAAGSFAGLGGSPSANLARFKLDGVPDSNFNPNPNGPVNTIAVRSGINAVATSTTNFVWLNADGNLHPGFSPGANVKIDGQIFAIARQADGKILIGGLFRNVTGPDGGDNLIRFNTDGSLDTTFSAHVTNQINSINVLPNGQLIVAGLFDSIGGGAHGRIARLNADGTIDPTFYNSSPDGIVLQCVVLPSGKLLIGGTFPTVLSGVVPNIVHLTHNNIALLNADGTVDDTFKASVDGTVNAIVVQADGNIVVGGTFSGVLGNGDTIAIVRRQLARYHADGSLDKAWDANHDDLNFNTTILAMALQADGKVVVGGTFPTINNITRVNIARLDTDGQVDPSFDPSANAFVSSLNVLPDGRILAAGNFTTIASLTRNHIARLNSDGTIDSTFNVNINGPVNIATLQSDGTVFAGGQFNTVQPNAAYMVGGSFTQIGGRPGINLALLNADGTAGTAFQPNPNGVVNALATQTDGKTVAGGAFTVMSGIPRLRLARFNADNTLDTAFNPGVDGTVTSVVLQGDGRIVIGGSFSNVAGAARANIARLNGDGTLDSSYNPGANGAVNALALQADGSVVAGGTFTTLGGASLSRIGRIGANGIADTSFSLGANGAVNAIAVQSDGRIVIGGAFTGIAGGLRNYIARVSAGGVLDTTFDPSPDNAVVSLAVELDGRTLVGGIFSRIGGRQRSAMARLGATDQATQSFTLSDDLSTLVWTRGGTSPEIVGATIDYSLDNFRWTNLGQASRSGSTATWQLAGLSLPGDTAFYVRAQALVPTSQNTSSSLIEVVQAFYPRPLITGATSESAAAGAVFLYAISTTNGAVSYSATGLPNGLTINSKSGIISGVPTQTGTFNVRIAATSGAGTSIANLGLTITGSGGATTADGRIIALATRGYVATNSPLIGGFVIKGTTAKSILFRAVGPGLASVGVPASQVLTTPVLQVFDASGKIVAEGHSWGGGSDLASTFARLGEFPLAANSADAALLMTLAPGSYTSQVLNGGGVGSAGGTAIIELYDASDSAISGAPHLSAIAARGFVGDNGKVLVGGLAISGTNPKRFIIRGVGPNLVKAGVGGTLANPVLSVFNSANVLIATNDNWQTPVAVAGGTPTSDGPTIAAAAASVGLGAFDAGSTDAAVIITLSPGIYTVQVASADSTEGNGLVEIYELP